MKRNMTRAFSPLWVKLTAALLCTVFAICSFFAIMDAIFTSGWDKYENRLSQNRSDIAAVYSVMALEDYQEDYTNTQGPNYRATNFNYVIVQGDSAALEDVDLKDPTVYLLGSPEDAEGYTYSFHSTDRAWYSYDLSSLNLFSGYYAYSDPYYEIVYDNHGGHEYVPEEYVPQGVESKPLSTKHLWVLSRVNEPLNYELNDRFVQDEQVLRTMYFFAPYCPYLIPICLLLALVFFGILVIGCGHRPGDDEIHLRMADRIPLLIYLGIWTTIEAILIAIGVGVTDLYLHFSTVFWIECLMGFFFGMFGLALLATLITRCKAKKFWRYTLIWYLFAGCRKVYRMIRQAAEEHLSFFWRMVLLLSAGFLGLLFTLFVCLAFFNSWSFFAFLILLCYLLLAVAVLWFSLQLEHLRGETHKLALSKELPAIDTGRLKWKFKEHAEDINIIKDAMSDAVTQQIKSERFRTELITNVSHDIKTPLTSIINYVDLLEKQDIQDPTSQEYLKVLNRQSSRLKKLIEDLMEASKASTGNLEVHLESTDIGLLLNQAVGEFSDRLESKNLQLVVRTPENPVMLEVDGRHLWRVFDNLLSNICKYSLSGSRVYITMEQKDKNTSLVFRNISENELNISSEEILQRFVRGDSSRHTEGSGLGLSIAQSLMQLMNGLLLVDVDGDLFKVTLMWHH